MANITINKKSVKESRVHFYYRDEMSEGQLVKVLVAEIEAELERSDGEQDDVSLIVPLDDDISTFSEGDALALKGLLLKLYNEAVKNY